MRLLSILAFLLLSASPLLAGLYGPTLKFDYGEGRPQSNPLGKFMYFVPLISPEEVSVFTNADNTQCARVVSFHCRTNGNIFHAVCEFDFIGTGLQSNVFDHTFIIHKHAKELKAGKVLAHQLCAITVHGSGSGSMELDGVLTNGQPVVTNMRLRFNNHGRLSPVDVDLQDIVLRNGAFHYENETIARVNTLSFQRKSGPPKMEVTLGSVKRADAGNGLWADFIGSLKGAAANFLLPPLNITTNGQDAMLNFGEALAMEKPTFTFPYASRLTNGAEIKM